VTKARTNKSLSLDNETFQDMLLARQCVLVVISAGNGYPGTRVPDLLPVTRVPGHYPGTRILTGSFYYPFAVHSTVPLW